MGNNWQKAGDSFEKRDIVDLRRDDIGTITQGTYEERRLVHSKETNRDSMLYNITIDGKKVSFWGTTVLDARFEEVPSGSEVRIVYKGKTPSATKGHSPMHAYDVFFREPGAAGDSAEEAPESEEKNSDIPF